MRILLVHPAFPRTYWGFQYVLPITGARATLPPLGLITVAALLPPAWPVRLVDLNVEPLTDAALAWADAVLVGGMLIQAPSMREVVTRARTAGRRTVVGGPAATTAPDLFDDADVVFGGEVEGRAAELAAAIETGAPRRIAPPAARPALADTPPPRFDLLRPGAYASMAVQTSRGCPHGCEFCDIVEIFGRRPRVKDAASVVRDLDRLHRQGWRGSVFVVDDNFIGNVKEARRLLPEIARWQDAHGRPFDLYTEASVNLARDPDLLAAMAAAGFNSVFVGIETPSADALREAGKHQNLRLDLRTAIDRITAAGIEVMGGFIVGFDSDGPDAFEAQRRFLADAPVPLAMVGLLTALPGTALWRRLEREGRLRTRASGDQMARPNFAPAMDEETLLRGYADLLAALYDPAAYVRRCKAVAAGAPLPAGSQALRPGQLAIAARALWSLGIVGRRRRLFWSLVGPAALRSKPEIVRAIRQAIWAEHLVRYTQEDVLPRLAEAIEAVRRERRAQAAAAPASPPPQRAAAGWTSAVSNA